MAGFGNVPRKQTFRKGGFPPRKSKAASIAGKLYEQAMENKFKSQKGRRPEYRPSSFPLCSVLVYMKLVRGASLGYFENERSAAGDYFTSVGTTAHENIQYHMGFSGKIFGDWKCLDRACRKGQRALDLYDANGELVREGKLTRKNTTNNTCPKCGNAMEYVEKEINYKGLKGHIDCIIELPDGRYWVADYKTCTKTKIDSNKLPQKSHLKQLPSYCWVLKKKYKMEIAGFSLLYFSRDNPFNYYEHAETWTKNWDRRCKEMVANERLKFKAGVNSFAKMNPAEAIKYKPCKTLAFYEKEIAYYTECPMLDVCFNEKKLRKALKKHTKDFPSDEQDRQHLIDAININ
tara:strand:+ start:123791 stop:124831 length:1041 start_codon:yes stop_codon:yes gene_type:complete